MIGKFLMIPREINISAGINEGFWTQFQTRFFESDKGQVMSECTIEDIARKF